MKWLCNWAGSLYAQSISHVVLVWRPIVAMCIEYIGQPFKWVDIYVYAVNLQKVMDGLHFRLYKSVYPPHMLTHATPPHTTEGLYVQVDPWVGEGQGDNGIPQTLAWVVYLPQWMRAKLATPKSVDCVVCAYLTTIVVVLLPIFSCSQCIQCTRVILPLFSWLSADLIRCTGRLPSPGYLRSTHPMLTMFCWRTGNCSVISNWTLYTHNQQHSPSPLCLSQKHN